ncbi:hypothetical protein KVP09_15480 [Alcaligenaceae bacterium CGII-47]|nr:hypothetical protein [Alcaligenaceae bacterium CGII-47]
MAWQALFGEKSTTKLAAVFDTEEQMNGVMAALSAGAQLLPAQIRVVRPGEHDFGRKLEPEGRGIVRTAVRAHIILGLAGLVIGFLVWLMFFLSGVGAIVSSPALSVGAFLFFGVIAGLLLGGLVTARPDHMLVIQHVRTAAEQGNWSLVIHPMTPQQCDAALRILEEAGAQAVRSI